METKRTGRGRRPKPEGRNPKPEFEPREAFGVRRVPALCESSALLEVKAPEYGALQTLRALVCRPGFSLQRHSKNLREDGKLPHMLCYCPWDLTSSRTARVRGRPCECPG